MVVRRQFGVESLVRDRQVEPVAERLEIGLGQLLHLVRGVASLERLERPALDRLGEDDRRLTDVRARRLERGVHLAVVVAAAREPAQVVVGHVLDHASQPRVGAEEVLADVGAGLDRVGLVLAVRGLVHLVDQRAVAVAREQRVPVASPHDLDHVPARTAEVRLELLDDLAVAADGAVEALQVAVDDERQVVEFLASSDADGAERLDLVHLAVAQERPDMRVGRVGDAARVQVAVEPGLVDRADRADAHRHRRELPEVRHQPRVRVGRQAVGRVRLLLPEPVELLGRHAPFEERARVDARRSVALEVDLVAHPAGEVLAAEEVVVADLVERGRARIGRDVAADADRLVGARHHDRRVPADVGADAPLDVLVARKPRLALGRNRVDVVGAAQCGDADLALAGALEQLEHEETRALPAVGVDGGVERFDPLTGLVGIDVGQLAREPVGDDVESVSGHPTSEHLCFPLGSERELPSGNPNLPLRCHCGKDDYVGTGSTSAATSGEPGVAARMGLKPSMIVMEIGFDDDVDAELRDSIEDHTGEELVDEDSDEVVDVVLIWYREGDEDLTDLLVDAISPLADDGVIWLLTPKRGRVGHVEASDISEAAAVAGLSETSIVTISQDWSGNRLVGRRSGGKK